MTSIELIVIDSNKVFKNNINNIINDYFDGIELNHDIFLNNVDEMISLIWFLFSASLHLRKYIITAKCEVIHLFFTKSCFIGDYEKLVHTISDTNSDFFFFLKDVFDIIHKFPNTTLAYHSNDKYYIISKKNGEYTVGYNFIVRHKNMINIVFWGKHKNDGIFSFPSIEEIWKSYGSKNTIKRISISSLEGLYQISEFMINSIDWILYKLNTEYVTTF